ncbi:MAG: 16S rRNA (guanine(966)-N(2))-methyltransferase RsmD [Lysobacterales bacterium CG17_big_fil_post_rev_8_21_14_2_50_64_11]|nr:MAG: 16S rRNA (guanine(966)-N(2))-methyltransferase RsmD [Xanthomonadales bacterium CG17_big_fil_post_rev_8_21_14_2_50_64_11]PIX61134.1 MAG: 16S rRNA (guanine(966)-N(2))-methyltransferase RsmD [Xanthomonadales bacterium CG_4_10_14_3_um_filter_64_11]
MNPQAPGKVRIIAGSWRNSRLDVVDLPGLRPTPERVRETLFNWLQPRLPGARCLDLFAGSGALGFEAASRGAGHVLLVERDASLVQRLNAAKTRLRAEQVDVVQADALHWLQMPQPPFDIVFIDPPFAHNLWPQVLPALLPMLANDARIHVESPLATPYPVPARWLALREGHTRDMRHVLYAAGVASPATLGSGEGQVDPKNE